VKRPKWEHSKQVVQVGLVAGISEEAAHVETLLKRLETPDRREHEVISQVMRKSKSREIRWREILVAQVIPTG
jgi:hypothetical protein